MCCHLSFRDNLTRDMVCLWDMGHMFRLPMRELCQLFGTKNVIQPIDEFWTCENSFQWALLAENIHDRYISGPLQKLCRARHSVIGGMHGIQVRIECAIEITTDNMEEMWWKIAWKRLKKRCSVQPCDRGRTHCGGRLWQIPKYIGFAGISLEVGHWNWEQQPHFEVKSEGG